MTSFQKLDAEIGLKNSKRIDNFLEFLYYFKRKNLLPLAEICKLTLNTKC